MRSARHMCALRSSKNKFRSRRSGTASRLKMYWVRSCLSRPRSEGCSNLKRWLRWPRTCVRIRPRELLVRRSTSISDGRLARTGGRHCSAVVEIYGLREKAGNSVHCVRTVSQKCLQHRISAGFSPFRTFPVAGPRAPLPTCWTEAGWHRVPGVTIRFAAKPAGPYPLPPHLPRAATRGLFSVAKSAFEALYPIRRREPHQLQLPYRNSHRPENGNVSVLRTPGSGTVQPTSTKRFTSIS